MTSITITEALAEIPTTLKRIEKKREFVKSFLYRQSAVRDPHEKDGGSSELIERERQAIVDLENRIIAIRNAIQNANQVNEITIGNQTRTINEWLIWRREIANNSKSFDGSIAAALNVLRNEAMKKGIGVSDQDKGYSSDYVVNINEKKLAETIENLEEILGKLDGQLSLNNARLMIEVP